MKKIILLLAVFLLFGCEKASDVADRPLEEELPFEVKKTVLADGNYSLKPNVHSIGKSSDSEKFLVSLGAVESGSPSVDKVTILNNSLNFYTSIDESGSSTISIPQISVEVSFPDGISAEGLKLNIIKSNYINLKLDYSSSQALGVLKEEHGIVSKVKPDTKLVKDGDSYTWKFDFESAFIDGDPLSPLLSVKAAVDSQSGEIVQFQSETISDVVTQGYIEDFNSLYNKIVCSKTEASDRDPVTNIFFKDLNTGSDKLEFSSSRSLKSIDINDSSEYLSIVETSISESRVLIKVLEAEEMISFDFDGDVTDAIWSGNTLYVSHKPDVKTTEISKYSFEQEDFESVLTIEGDVQSFSVIDDQIAYSTGSSDSSVYLYKDGEARFISNGKRPIFKDSNTILFLAPNAENRGSDVFEYNLVSSSFSKLLENYSVKNMFASDSFLYLIVSGDESDLYDLVSHSFSDSKTETLFTFTNNNIFFNFNKNKVYFSTTTGAPNSRRVYSIEI